MDFLLYEFAGDVDRNKEQEENLGSVYQDQRVQPCHLSSSIYYGGPDVYFQPQNSSINSTVNRIIRDKKARNFMYCRVSLVELSFDHLLLRGFLEPNRYRFLSL